MAESLEQKVPIYAQEFRSARELLGLSQKEAAGMLRRAESDIRNLETGSIESLKLTEIDRYSAIIRLADLYYEVACKADLFHEERGTSYKGMIEVLRNHLREPSYVYGKKSAIEFAASRESGIFDVVGMERRTLA